MLYASFFLCICKFDSKNLKLVKYFATKQEGNVMSIQSMTMRDRF